LSIASASRSFVTISSGRCFFRRLVIESLLARRAKDLHNDWIRISKAGQLFIEPGSPWENGYVESFSGKLRDELLAREAFDTLLEAKVLIERWRQHYNTIRPHSALGYPPPGSRGATALCGRLGCASATAQG
jgi:transposase InsO family protein